MFDIGFWEILLLAVVALVVVGPERLPRLIRVTGLWLGRAQASLQAIKNDISRELRAEEIKQALRQTGDPSGPPPSAKPKEEAGDNNRNENGN